MLDNFSKEQIEKISYELLKSSKALDKFPTPVDIIVEHADLIVEKGIDLSKIQHSFLSRFITDSARIFSQIRGILDRKQKVIYLDLSQSTARKNFVKLHETGHSVLSWQKAVLDCLDDDSTLDPLTQEQFEAEANYFSSATLFQLDRFQTEMNKLELGINSAMQLAKMFGASNHAAIRRYVECSKKKCALLVLEKNELTKSQPIYNVRDYFQSDKFTTTYGSVFWPTTLGWTWDFVKDYYSNRRLKSDGQVTLDTKDGQALFSYHFFNSTYNAFVLIFPKGENRSSKTRVLIKGYEE